MTMRYTLITAQGKIYMFNLISAAEVWQQAYGGIIFDQTVVQTQAETV
jgi:hypothetical protein